MSNIINDYLNRNNIYSTFESNKEYKFVLYKANKIIQSQELINTQLHLRDDINKSIETFIPQASILNGGKLQLKDLNAIASETEIYFDSYVIKVNEKTFVHSNILNSTLCIKIDINLITYNQDQNLLDKHPKSRNANVEGADRLQIVGEWVKESELTTSDIYFKIFTLENGLVKNKSNLSFLDKPEYLRKYDFLTNGNYVVDGFDILFKGEKQINFFDNGDLKLWDTSSYSISPNTKTEYSKNWFIDSKLSTIKIDKQSFDLIQTDVPENPLFYSKISILDSLSKPEISIKIDNVNTISYKPIIIKGYAKANKQVNLNFNLIQNFGLGGSAEVLKVVGNKVVNTTWTLIEFEVLVPNISGRIIGIDSYLNLVLSNNVAEIYELDLSTFSCKNKYSNQGDSYIFSLREGIANVNGSEVILNTNKDFSLPISSDTLTIKGEAYTFITNSTYSLHKINTREINRIFGQKEITSNVVHGSYIDAPDLLPNTPVFSITSISQGSTVYVQGVDYTLQGDQVYWISGANNPSPNSTYQATYKYIEYNIQYSYNPYNNTFTIQDTIVNNSTFYVDYSIVIPRFDRIVINKYGQISTIIGNPNFDKTYPYISLDKGLHLADVEINYNEEPKINLVYNRPYKLSDLNYLYNTIKDLKKDNLNLQLSVKSFNSLYTGSDADVEHNDTFLNDNILRKDNITCDIYKGICTSQVQYASQSYIHQINTLPNEDLQECSNIHLLNDYSEYNVDIKNDDKLALVKLDKYEYKWYSNNSKKILFKDEEYIRDYQIFGKTLNELNPEFTLDLIGWGFGQSEFIEIKFDNEIITTITSQPNGEFIKTIIIPANTLKAGKRKLRIYGIDSKKEFITNFHLTSVDNTSHINDYLTICTRSSKNETTSISELLLNKQNYTNTNWFWRGNPIFQKFIFENDFLLKSLDLYIKESNSDIVVYISECTAGVPDPSKVITHGYIKSVDINLNNTNKIDLIKPAFIESTKEYAIILTSSSSSFKIGLVNNTLNNGLRLNQLKEFYSSVNNSILLLEKNKQLAVSFNTYDFTPDALDTNYVKNDLLLNTINVVSITDFAVICGIKSFDNTSLSFKIILLDRSNETYICEPFTNIYFNNYTGRIQIKAQFTSYNFKLSSYLDSFIVYCLGSLNVTSIYETNKLLFKGDRINVSLQLSKDLDSSINPQYWDGSQYVDLTYEASKTIDLGVDEIRYYYKDISTVLTETSLKILLLSIQNGARPVIKNLRMWYNIPFGGADYLRYTPSGDINFANGKAINLKNGTNNSDGINKSQLDAQNTSLTELINNEIENVNLNLTNQVTTAVNTLVDPKISTAKQELALDYNTKIDNLGNLTSQEISTAQSTIINQTTQNTTTQVSNLNQSIQTQFSNLENGINNTIDQKVGVATTQIIADVNAGIDTVVDTKVSNASNNLLGTINTSIDSKILEDHNTQATQTTQEISQAKTDVLSNVDSRINDAKTQFQSDIGASISVNNTALNLPQFENSTNYLIYDGSSASVLNLFNNSTRLCYHDHVVNDGANVALHTLQLPAEISAIMPLANYDIVFKIHNVSLLRTLTLLNDDQTTYTTILPQDTLVLYVRSSDNTIQILKIERSATVGVAKLGEDNVFTKTNNFKKDILFKDNILLDSTSNKFNLPAEINYTINQSKSLVYNLGSSSNDFYVSLFDTNNLYIEKHVVFSDIAKDLYLPTLTNITTSKNKFSLSSNSFIFSIHNISSSNITLKTKGSTDLVHIVLLDSGDQTSVIIPSKQTIELLFNFSTNKLYEI